MSETVTILYCGEPVSVPKEVADFLEQDRKREQAQDRQDTRRLSKSEFETAPSGPGSVRRPWKIPYSGTSSLKVYGTPWKN